ncbi:MAG: twin-arginine translocase subunit TatC, partial [Dehalococcoidia bacterium]|nr:twin-arginine translocase subunit TatC [Dehalococcoidia bacterium]
MTSDTDQLETELDEPLDTESGEMTLLEHLLELRNRVTWSAAAVLLGMIPFFYLPLGLWLIEFLIEPAYAQNDNFRAQAITPMENIFTYFFVALLGGITLGMPMLVYQALRFTGPALTNQEKKWVIPLVIGASFSFVIGLSFGYLIVLPTAYSFLFSFGSQFADVTPTISSYMDLTIRLLLVMGIV